MQPEQISGLEEEFVNNLIAKDSATNFIESYLYKLDNDDVMNAINNGEIIEQYPDDYPFPSCLILGITINDEYVHDPAPF